MCKLFREFVAQCDHFAWLENADAVAQYKRGDRYWPTVSAAPPLSASLSLMPTSSTPSRLPMFFARSPPAAVPSDRAADCNQSLSPSPAPTSLNGLPVTNVSERIGLAHGRIGEHRHLRILRRAGTRNPASPPRSRVRRRCSSADCRAACRRTAVDLVESSGPVRMPCKCLRHAPRPIRSSAEPGCSLTAIWPLTFASRP